jgi:SsrA-binding protein
VARRGHRKAAQKPKDGGGVIASNRRARHDYHIVDTVEAGLALTGTEVKSLRAGKASLAEAYATVRGGEAWLMQAHIPEYSHGNRQNHEPTRERKLLLHRREIDELDRFAQAGGRTLVPLARPAMRAVARSFTRLAALLAAAPGRLSTGRTLAWSVLGIAALALVISLGLLGDAAWRERRFDRTAQSLPGLVLAVNGQSRVTQIQVAFDGSPYARVEQFKVLGAGNYRSGERVTVLVDPAEPTVAHLEGEPGDFLSHRGYLVYGWSLLTVFVAVPAGGALLLYPRWRRRRIPKHSADRTVALPPAPSARPAPAIPIEPNTLGDQP